MINKAQITCPNCGKLGTWNPDNIFRPFCSSRCKLIDLGEWANEERKIPGSPLYPEFSKDDDFKSEDER